MKKILIGIGMLMLGAGMIQQIKAAPICPDLSFEIDGTNPVCTDEPVLVTLSYTDIPGDCHGITRFPYVRVYWEVEGLAADPQHGLGGTAEFTPLTSGKGTVKFKVVARTTACPDCNAEYELKYKFDAVKAQIAGDDRSFCTTDISGSIQLTGDSYSPNGFAWTVSSSYLYWENAILYFYPSGMPVGTYTATVYPVGRNDCSSSINVTIRCCFSGFECGTKAVNWYKNGWYDASSCLEDSEYGRDKLTFELITLSGDADAKIDASGIVQFGKDGGGEYLITVSPNDDPDCFSTMTLYVLRTLPLMDASYDDSIDRVDEELMSSDGGLVNVNHDDDNRNNIPDRDDAGPVANENDLERVKLIYEPESALQDVPHASLELYQSSEKIKLWLDPKKEKPLTQFIWTAGDEPPPEFIYVEALEPSESPRDIYLELRYNVLGTEYHGQGYMTALQIRLVPDWNHDRSIDEDDKDKATVETPFRFWINDDKDTGDLSSGTSDLPGQANGNAS